MQIDLTDGVVPISAAASQLARRLKQAQASKQPIIVTQKGYPTGVLLSVEAYLELKAAAEAGAQRAEQLRRERILTAGNEAYAALADEEAAS